MAYRRQPTLLQGVYMLFSFRVKIITIKKGHFENIEWSLKCQIKSKLDFTQIYIRFLTYFRHVVFFPLSLLITPYKFTCNELKIAKNCKEIQVHEQTFLNNVEELENNKRVHSLVFIDVLFFNLNTLIRLAYIWLYIYKSRILEKKMLLSKFS